MTPELREACRRAMHVLTRDGRTLRAGRASLFVLAELGYRRTAAVLGLPPFAWLTELGYWVVSLNRRRFARLVRHLPDEGRINTLRNHEEP